MTNRRMWGLRSYVFTCLCAVFWSAYSFGQYDLQFQGPEKIEWCETGTYDFRLDRFSAHPVDDLVLHLTFDHDVTYLSNSLGLLVTPEDPRSITLDLQEFEQCGFLSGSITVFPVCASSLVTLGTIARLRDGSDILSAQNSQALMGTNTLKLSFGNYIYDAETSNLTKTITLTNVNTTPITSFDIALTGLNGGWMDSAQTQGWSGTYGDQQASPGVYVYDIVVQLIDSTEQRFISSVTLIP